MAILKDAFVSIDGTDVSARVRSVNLPFSANFEDSTNMGSAGWREGEQGTKQGQVTIEFNQATGAGSIDAVMWAAFIAGEAAVIVRPAAASASASNPQFTFTAIVTAYTPVDGNAGALHTSSVTWDIDGAPTRATS